MYSEYDIRMKENYEKDVPECKTEKIPLCGSGFKKFKQVRKYIAEIFDRVEADGFSEYDAWFLVTNYGTQTETILEYYAELTDEDPHVRMAKAELRFGINYEMVMTPMDFFIRRTGRLYFDIQSVRNLMEPILEELTILLGTDKDQIGLWRTELERALEEHSNFSLERV